MISASRALEMLLRTPSDAESNYEHDSEVGKAISFTVVEIGFGAEDDGDDALPSDVGETGGVADCSRLREDEEVGPSSLNRAQKTTLGAIFGGLVRGEILEKIDVGIFKGVAERRSAMPLLGWGGVGGWFGIWSKLEH